MSFRQAFPQRISAHHPLNELLPQHAVGDDPVPLATHQLGSAQGTCVQKGQDVLCYVLQTPRWRDEHNRMQRIIVSFIRWIYSVYVRVCADLKAGLRSLSVEGVCVCA